MATIKSFTDKPKRKSYFKHNVVYCKKGDVVVTYPNVLVAEKETGVYSDRIYKCCNGKMSYAGGFAWSYAPFEEYPDDDRIWKDVEGYENLYQVSTDGLVRSSHKGLWEILSAGRTKHGYYNVLLHKDGKRKNERVQIGARKDVALSIINYLDNNSVGMCLSNMECEDIEDACVNSKWTKLYNYMKKNYPPKEEFYMYPQYDEEDNLVGFTTDYEGKGAFGKIVKL